jgi:hypothetical protein
MSREIPAEVVSAALSNHQAIGMTEQQIRKKDQELSDVLLSRPDDEPRHEMLKNTLRDLNVELNILLEKKTTIATAPDVEVKAKVEAVLMVDGGDIHQAQEQFASLGCK